MQCMCNTQLGYTGVSGGFYCNCGLGFALVVVNTVHCGCNANCGHVWISSSPLKCGCNPLTGHTG